MSACRGKKSYPSAERARSGNRGASFRVRPYQCEKCAQWHVANADKSGQSRPPVQPSRIRRARQKSIDRPEVTDPANVAELFARLKSESASSNLERLKAVLKAKETPKAKGQGLRRGSAMKRVNKPRKAAMLAACFGPQSRLCRLAPCTFCNKPAPSEPHHWPTRGAGGKDSDTLPVCRNCHRTVDGKAEWRGILMSEATARMADQLRGHDCLATPEAFGAAIRCFVCHAGINAEDVQP